MHELLAGPENQPVRYETDDDDDQHRRHHQRHVVQFPPHHQRRVDARRRSSSSSSRSNIDDVLFDPSSQSLVHSISEPDDIDLLPECILDGFLSAFIRGFNKRFSKAFKPSNRRLTQMDAD